MRSLLRLLAALLGAAGSMLALVYFALGVFLILAFGAFVWVGIQLVFAFPAVPSFGAFAPLLKLALAAFAAAFAAGAVLRVLTFRS